jgi:hypothetical protein
MTMTTRSKRPSLTAYAEANPTKKPGAQAWITTIPEFVEVQEAYLAGVPPITIVRWLTDSPDAKPVGGCGYSEKDASLNRVRRWLRERLGPQESKDA